MAIYSLQHKSIGRSRHDPGTAGAHIKYICRASTARQILRNAFPQSPFKIATWLDRREEEMRKNARVLDKIMIALPLEFTEKQREDVARTFIEAITKNKVPWVAAFHDLGKDEKNPHVHIAIHDRDIETQKPACGLAEKGSTQKLRILWQDILNKALEDAGLESRVDHRSLKEQGIERTPTIHEGPKVRAMLRRGVRPVSKTRTDRFGREIRYADIDQGKTRTDHNQGIRTENEKTQET